MKYITNSPMAKLIGVSAVILAVVAGGFLLRKSSHPADGVTETVDPIERSKTLHFRKWIMIWANSPEEGHKLSSEEWYDLENDRYRIDCNAVVEGRPWTASKVCDGEYIMCPSREWSKDGEIRCEVDYLKVDPNESRDVIANLGWYRRAGEIKGFRRIRQDTINGRKFDLWQGEYNVGLGAVERVRYDVWLSPVTAELGAVKTWRKKQGDKDWRQTSEYTGFEYGVPLAAGLFRTEPPSSEYEIRISKEKAPICRRVNWFDRDIYGDLSFVDEPLRYLLEPVFLLRNGVILAGYRSVDNRESQDQSKYFENLRIGGPLARLPIEVVSLFPEPDAGDVQFTGFHLAHTRKQTKDGPRWFEWILYVPNTEPPKPEHVLRYRGECGHNVSRSEDPNLSSPQGIILSPRELAKVETKEDFARLVLGAMTKVSDDGVIPEHITYDSVLRLAEQLAADLHISHSRSGV
ncbi:MAG: hypothetical protein ACM3VT_15060 [Solirubrobacterales bacterium]